MYGPLQPRADLFRSRGPFICYGRTSVPRMRTVFIHQDPEWTFLLTRAWGTDHFLPRALRARTFLLIFHVRALRARTFCLSRADARRASRADARFAHGPFSFFPQGAAVPRLPPPFDPVSSSSTEIDRLLYFTASPAFPPPSVPGLGAYPLAPGRRQLVDPLPISSVWRFPFLHWFQPLIAQCVRGAI